MPPLPQFVTNTLERMFFSPAVVSEVVPLSGHFRLIEIEGEALKSVTWIPGRKFSFISATWSTGLIRLSNAIPSKARRDSSRSCMAMVRGVIGHLRSNKARRAS